LRIALAVSSKLNDAAIEGVAHDLRDIRAEYAIIQKGRMPAIALS
jgi:hypothetical protein